MQHPLHPHHSVITRLQRLGPVVSTSVEVNGRRLRLDAAMTLIASLPEHSRVWLQHWQVMIDPDPFVAPDTGGKTETADLVASLLERQVIADRTRPWWQRLRWWKT
jgi:hypothetical protein